MIRAAGGLVGRQVDGSITASYATGAADGGAGAGDSASGLVGNRRDGGVITASYGFGEVVGEVEQEGGSDGATKPEGVSAAAQLTAANAGPVWDSAGNSTLGAWDFGTDSRIPALKYADYDAAATAFACDHFPVGACGTLLPGQESQESLSVGGRPGAIVRLTASIRHLSIESWNWQQLAGVPVILKGADTATPTFTMPVTLSSLEFKLTAQARGSEEDSTSSGEQFSSRIIIFPLIDADGNGLIEIYSLLYLHNMRYNLAGTSYRTGAVSVGNSRGCPDSGCRGYELVQDLDFDGDGDGQTWWGDGDGGYTLDPGDNADYFPVEEDGTGGWLPIGDDNNPFIAAFDGNGHSIRNLAIRRNQESIGLFGSTGSAAAIGNLGLIDNLADYTGSSSDANYIGGLVGLQDGGSIMESFAIGAVDGGGGDHDFAGGLVGYKRGGLITASYATGGVAGRGWRREDAVGGLVGRQDGGSIMASYASGTADGGAGAEDGVGGLVGQQFNGLIWKSFATGAIDGGEGEGGDDRVGGLVGEQHGGVITASYATGTVDGGGDKSKNRVGGSNRVGGLVGWQRGGSITASYATGVVGGGDGRSDQVGGLVGHLSGRSQITASYATGAVDGGDGSRDRVGGLVGLQDSHHIFSSWRVPSLVTASYATGPVTGGNGDSDYVGGLVGLHRGGLIMASYATGTADGGGGDEDLVDRLVGRHDDDDGSLITESYGFGHDGSTKPGGVSLAAQLTAANAGSAWNDAGNHTLGAWEFSIDGYIPVLKYADYDGDGPVFDCDHFPVDACGTLLPGQESVIASGPAAAQLPGAIITLSALIRDLTIGSWDWQQLAGAPVTLRGADTAAPNFTMPVIIRSSSLEFELTATTRGGKQYSSRIIIFPMADVDGNGLIEIYSPLDLHNMRYDLAGTSYLGNSRGCPALGCHGYELVQDLDFDGDGDGRTWRGDGDGGYSLDPEDNADYFPVEEDGTGGWLPIGDGTNPFIAVFEGNGYTISSLATRRDQVYIGLFGRTGSDAIIRNLGLIDNLADYTGSSGAPNYIGSLVGRQKGGSIMASYATGPAAGGAGGLDYVGGLVGFQGQGSIMASYATGPVDGGDGDYDVVGGLVGWQESGSITASYATGVVEGGDGDEDSAGGLVGRQDGGVITASYATGVVEGGDGDEDSAGGLVGRQDGGVITASYATGAVEGGDGTDNVGGLVGWQDDGVITASYATGAADGGEGDYDVVGGLVGWQDGGVITASYATGAVFGGNGASDHVGGLVGYLDRSSITASYGFGEVVGEVEQEGGSDGSTKPEGVSAAAQLTAANAGAAWNDAGGNTLGAWDFGIDGHIPALKYADYDGDGPAVFACDQFPISACDTLLPGQRSLIDGGPAAAQAPGAIITLTASIRGLTVESWSWQRVTSIIERQLAGITVTLRGADTGTPTFPMPVTRVPLVFKLTIMASDGKDNTAPSSPSFPCVATADADGNGLIEIYSLA